MDEELEEAIERAGREIVFAVVEAHGWPRGSMPPKYVWWEAIRTIDNLMPPATAATPDDEHPSSAS